MANNVKLNRISQEFGQRINDGFNSTGVPIAGDTDGIILTASQRMNYINKAMLKLFNDFWVQVQGEKKIFAQIFPELVQVRTVLTSSTSSYIVSTPNLDYFQLIEATINGTQAAVLPSHLYQTVKSGNTPQIKGDTNNPVCIEIGRTIYFLPDGSAFRGQQAIFTILRLPINGGAIGAGGSFLAMDAAISEDSPFYDQWNTTIAEYAEKLFRIDAKE